MNKGITKVRILKRNNVKYIDLEDLDKFILIEISLSTDDMNIMNYLKDLRNRLLELH